MKHILITFITVCGLFGCDPAFCFSTRPLSNEVEKPEVTPTPSPSPEIVDADAGRELLFNIAEKDLCAQTAHDVQGTPPKSYMRGVVLTYVKTLCNPDSDVYKIASQPLGDASKDALAHYGLKPQAASERLNMVFALMIGSAARESSWRWCVGKDPGASNTSGETCEAGLYQTSWNSRKASPALVTLFNEFSEYPAGCFATEYKGKTTCSSSNMKNWGTGEGVTFQALTKECPGFATEYHAIMVRVNRTHYGPINKKKSEIKPACISMFERVRQAVVKDPNLCFVL